jgi:hypothetical protein
LFWSKLSRQAAGKYTCVKLRELEGDIDLTRNNLLEGFLDTSFEAGNANLSLLGGLGGSAR